MAKRKMKRKASTKGRGSTKKKRKVSRTNPEHVRTAELKNIDINTSTNVLAGTYTLSLLNAMGYGNTAVTHVGRKVVMKSLFLRYQVNMGATSTLGGQVRVLVVYDKQANAAAPAATDVLTSNDFHSTMALPNAERFVVILDKIMEPIGVATGSYSVAFKKYKKINLEMIFNSGSAGTIADIQTGSVYLLACHNGSIATAGPSATFTSRIRFNDS